MLRSLKKQQTVAGSNTEVEYKSLANKTIEIIWIQTLIKEFCFPFSFALILWCDNLGVTFLTVNPVFHSWTKHMTIDFHFI